MDTFLEFFKNAVVFVGLLVLLALANQQLFQKIVADLLVDPLVALILKSVKVDQTAAADRLKLLAATIKRLQPVLVICAALLISYGLNQPLTAVLASFVPNSLLDPAAAPFINALLIAVASFKVHDIYEDQQAKSTGQSLMTAATARSYTGLSGYTEDFDKAVTDFTKAYTRPG